MGVVVFVGVVLVAVVVLAVAVGVAVGVAVVGAVVGAVVLRIMCKDFNFINIWFYIQLHEQSRPRYYAVSATAQDSFQPILVRSRYARTTRPGITCTIQLVRQSQSINACSTITSLEMQVYQLSHK